MRLAWRALRLLLFVGVAGCASVGPRSAPSAPSPSAPAPEPSPAPTSASPPVTAVAEPDADRDRIPDSRDKCPNEPETYNGVDDEDGCPDQGRVVVHICKLEIIERIHFAAGARELPAASASLLDSVAQILKGNPQIGSVEVGGHTAANERDRETLASDRADAVRAALISRGVEVGRLRTRGYGSTQPLCAGKDADCRRQNRRVEFRILSRADRLPD